MEEDREGGFLMMSTSQLIEELAQHLLIAALKAMADEGVHINEGSHTAQRIYQEIESHLRSPS